MGVWRERQGRCGGNLCVCVCVCLCVEIKGCGERDGCVAVEKGQVCVYVCVCKVGVGVFGETGGASLCGCATTGVWCGLTDVGVLVWKTGVHVYVLVWAGKLGCVFVGIDGFVCVCVDRLGCLCGERDWGCEGGSGEL